MPSGLSGKVLLEVPNTQTGQRFPSLVVMDLANNQRIEIGIGSWSSFSPNGSKVFYTDDKGIHMVDLATRNDVVLEWANELDYRPLLSPDWQWLAFMRGNEGIHIAHLDGSSLRKIPKTTATSILVSWMPDGSRILAATLGQWGSQVHSVDINTGESTNYFLIEIQKGGFDSASNDSSRVAFAERAFGKLSYGVFTSNLDGTGKKQVADLTDTALVGGWSPDGKWVNATTSIYNDLIPNYTSYLIQPDTCQVYMIPGWGGVVTGWVK
jgi:Tol biopolymer transport system component